MGEIYSKSSHGGRVSISFHADENTIKCVSCDDDFMTYPITWELEESDGGYRIIKTIHGLTSMGKTPGGTITLKPDTEESFNLNADSRSEACAEMAEKIASPYKGRSLGQMPVSYPNLKKSILNALEDVA